MAKQPKINNAVYCKGKLIGINAYIDKEENRMVYDELPKKLPVQVDLPRVDYILNWSEIKKPSSYYRIN